MSTIFEFCLPYFTDNNQLSPYTEEDISIPLSLEAICSYWRDIAWSTLVFAGDRWSKVAFDPEQPSLGSIWASVAPPHTPASIKRCISRVEGNPALLWNADLFADASSDTPLQEGHISILCTDGPGLSPNEPMAIVQVKNLSIPVGKYIIRNRAVPYVYWCPGTADVINSPNEIYYYGTAMETAKTYNCFQVNNHSPIIQVFKG